MQVAILDPVPGACEGCSAAALRRSFPYAGAAWPPPVVAAEPGPDSEASPDVVLLRGPTAAALGRVRAEWPAAAVVGVYCPAAHDEVSRPLSTALDDFVLCPVAARELTPRLERFLPRLSSGEPAAAGRRVREQFQLSTLVGESAALLTVLAGLPVIANSSATCLVLGETGTGKELFARALHFIGPRRNKPFIPVNCGALPDTLFENELFGHARGAYTDAGSFQEGLISLAEGGTLFLDEVDALSASAQVKLLRFLQDHEYRPLGSARAIASDLRVIAATNTALQGLVARRAFREDLFHRINVLRLAIPPLRDRLEDVPRLARHFIQAFARETRRAPPRLSPAALRRLLGYAWPGNVRELEGVIRRAIILSASGQLEAEEIELPEPERPADGSFREAKREAIDRFERAYLLRLMAEHDGNISRAARAAGKERSAFQRLLRKHSLGRDGRALRRTRGAERHGLAPGSPSHAFTR